MPIDQNNHKLGFALGDMNKTRELMRGDRYLITLISPDRAAHRHVQGIRINSSDGASWSAGVAEITKLNAIGLNVYITWNRLKDGFSGAKTAKADMAEVEVLFVDLDLIKSLITEQSISAGKNALNKGAKSTFA